MTDINYHRKGFGLKEQIEPELNATYNSPLINELRENDNCLQRGNITVKLAEAFGFCWGVDRAVSMAYETREHCPDRHIWITNEIIHNPIVNENLRKKNISFVPISSEQTKDFSLIQPGDVVILPAFGASIEELSLLEAKNCLIVDTTCPWVSRVWNRVAKYEQQDFTAVIHGKYNHEETIATSSRSKHHLIVQNLAEASQVCDFILHGGDKNEFLIKFKQALSADFDPDRNLVRIGVANQTTMLKSETEQIGKLFEKTMLAKYGPASLDKHFLSPGDTICDATQERQDAMLKLINEKIDLVLVIGGFNSSNTGHLHEIAETHGLKSFHIDGPECLGPGARIRHKTMDGEALKETYDFLPRGQVTIGVTSGASTPDQVVAQVLEKVFSIAEAQGRS
jgi:4-hydroxy-3-methylbut-2-en-1-yl diphosphate reductase